jgi:hypothetical protein
MLDPHGTPAGCPSVAEASSTVMKGTGDLDKFRLLRRFSRVLASSESEDSDVSTRSAVIVTACDSY